MSNPDLNIGAPGAADTSMIDEMLAGIGELEFGEEEVAVEELVEETIEEPAEPVIEELAAVEELAVEPLSDDDAAMLETELAKSEVYAEAESVTTMRSEEELAEEALAAPPPKVKTTRAPRKAAAPRVERDLSALPDDAFRLYDGVLPDKHTLIAARPTQKKIAEKFEGTIAALHAGKRPSVYVMDIFALLDSKGSATSSELVAALKAKTVKSGERPYSDGTARSQVGQIMALFPVLGIADRAGQSLSLRSDSTFASKMRALLAV